MQLYYGSMNKQRRRSWLKEEVYHPRLKGATHRPDSNQQPAAFFQPLRCLSSDPFSRKFALNIPLRRAANKEMTEPSASKNKAYAVFLSSHTPRWFANTPPIRMVIQLAHNQSENPMAQTANSQPSQTSQVPMQLNTPNSFVPELVRVSQNASDCQRLARYVSGFTPPEHGMYFQYVWTVCVFWVLLKWDQREPIARQSSYSSRIEVWKKLHSAPLRRNRWLYTDLFRHFHVVPGKAKVQLKTLTTAPLPTSANQM